MQRMDRYRAVLDDMLARGLAYRCYMTPQELDALRAEQTARGEKPRYDGRWRPENAQPARRRRAGVAPVIRFRNPDDGVVAWDDAVKGRIEIANAELDDLVIARARRHADLQLLRRRRRSRHAHHARHPRRRPRQQHAAADQHLPRARRRRRRSYAHLPTVLGSRRRRSCPSATARVASCSTRTTATCPRRWSTSSRASAGRTATPRCSARDAARRVVRPAQAASPSPARFDPEKLQWLNQEHMKRLPDDELGTTARCRYLVARRARRRRAGPPPGRGRPRCCATAPPRSPRWRMPRTTSTRRRIRRRTQARRARQRRQPRRADRARASEFATVDWTREAIGAAIKAAAARARAQAAAGDDAAARCWSAGHAQTPAIDAVLALLGRETTRARIAAGCAIERCVAHGTERGCSASSRRHQGARASAAAGAAVVPVK